MTLISVIIPVYKSSLSLIKIAEEFEDLKKSRGEKFEVIFVNDSPGCSETCDSLKYIAKKHPFVKVIFLRKNRGQHIALLVGMKHAGGDFVINMDDDLQHPVKEIPKLIDAINSDPDIDAVFAVPGYKNKKHSLWRNTGSFILNKIDTYFLKKPKGLTKSAFKIVRKDVVEAIVENHNAMPSISSLIVDVTHRIKNISVEHNKREYNQSSYTLSKLIGLSLNNIIHYSSLPLKLVGFVGFVGFGLSAFFIIFTLVKKIFFGIDFPGYASTVSLISFFGGLNLLALGLIGEYLIRIIKEQQKVKLDNFIKEII